MLRILASLAFLAAGLQAQTWIPFSPVVENLPGKSGAFTPAANTHLQYDSVNRATVVYQTYQAANESPAYPPTAYSNSIYLLSYNPEGTSTLVQKALHNWHNANPSGSPMTRPLAANRAQPTPPDRHAVFGVKDGIVYLFHGLNSGRNDTNTFAAAGVNPATDEIAMDRDITPMITRDAVRFTTSGTLPPPLVAGTDYFIIRVSGTVIRLATTSANARTGTAINLTGAGTGTSRLFFTSSATWHPWDVWACTLSTGRFGQIHVPVATGWHGGYTHTQVSSVVWHRGWNRFVDHYGKNFEPTAEYSWTFDPATHNLNELANTGNKRSGLSPEIYSAQSLTYDGQRNRLWNFGDIDTTGINWNGFGRSLWRLDNAGAWVEQAPVAARPSQRGQHCVQYIPGADRILVAGGWGPNGTALRDSWLYDPNTNTWDSLETAVLPAGNAHTYCTYDRYRGGVVLQNGSNWAFMSIGTPDIGPANPPVAPTLSALPSNVSLNAGNTLDLSVEVAGHPAPTLQWFRNGAAIPGATGTAYSRPNLSHLDHGSSFHVVATNSAGSATSATAVLNVAYAPVITQQPAAVTILGGAEAVFAAAAHANPPITAWVWLLNGGAVPDSDPDPAVLRTPPLTAAFNGAVVTLTVTNAAGQTVSQQAVLTIQSPPVIQDGPHPIAVNAGQPAQFQVVATGNPAPTYQWRKNGVVIPGAASAVLVTPPVTTVDQGAVFSVTVTNAVGSAEASAALSVNSLPAISAGPNPATVNAGATATFSVSAQGTPAITGYQWFRDNVAIAGATGASYTTPATTAALDSSVYHVVVTNPMGSVASHSALLRIQYAPYLVDGQSEHLQFRYVGNVVELSIDARANPPVTSYEWVWTLLNGFTPPNPTTASTTITIPNVQSMSQLHVMITARNSLGAATVSHTISIMRPPVLTISPAYPMLLEGQSATLSLVPGIPPEATVQWYRNGLPLPGATGATYAITGAGPVHQGTYRVGVTTMAYFAYSDSAYVTVQSPPVITNQPDSAYSFNGEAVSFGVTATGNPAPTYQWRRNGVNISGATSPVYTTPSPLTHADDSAAFSVVVTNAAGSVTSINGYLSVRYPPHILAHPASAAIFEGQSHTFSVAVKSSLPLNPYQWRRNGTAIPGATGASYTVTNAQLSESGASYSVAVNNARGTTVSNAAVLTVTPALVPPVITRQPADAQAHPGERPAFSLAATGIPAPEIRWFHYPGVQFATGETAVFPYPVEQRDSGLMVYAQVWNSQGEAWTDPVRIHVGRRPTRQTVSITGELYLADGTTPVGHPNPVGIEVVVRLFAAPAGGNALYTEEFLFEDGNGIPAEKGLFTLWLGTGWPTGDLSQVIASHSNLYAEFSVRGPASGSFETLSPRTPITSPLFAGSPLVTQGTADPAAPAPSGTFYRNTANGSTWLRMPSDWVRIAP